MSGSLNQARRRSSTGATNVVTIGGSNGRPSYEVKRKAVTKAAVVEWLAKKRSGTSLDKTIDQKKQIVNAIVDDRQNWIAKAEKINTQEGVSAAAQIAKAIPSSRVPSSVKSTQLAVIMFDIHTALNRYHQVSGAVISRASTFKDLKVLYDAAVNLATNADVSKQNANSTIIAF